MSSQSADWHLLFGLLALQNGLVSREQLVAGFAKWTSDKCVALDEVLVSDGSLKPEACDVLRQMVELHVERHGGEPRQSLMTLPGSELLSAQQDLEALGDSDLRQSIAQLPQPVPFATEPMGRVTSEGGRFRILRPLEGARGGMGVISVALDDELGRQVALKQILTDKADHAGYRQKFQAEAEVTGNLEHPGIVPVYGLGAGPDGRPYYAMRLVHGDNLSAKIKEFHESSSANPFAGKQRQVTYNSIEFHGLIDRLIDVAQAVRYAHSRGVLHRDLKPGNILVGEYGETLVIDWGLARIPQTEDDAAEAVPTDDGIDSHATLHIRSGSHVDGTMQGQALGTIGYAPPEQLNGRVDLITERSDVYALGAILYQILVGQPPVTRQGSDHDLMEVIKETLAGKITPPRRINRAIPKSLSAVCMRALEREPADRYESVEEFIAELEHWKADQPVAAAPDSITDRVMRLARQYRAVALATAATLLGIAIVAGIALVVVNRARVNEAAARGEAEVLAERNQTVVDSFVSAFRSADPENEGVTSQMTALEVLAQALAGIETDDELAKDELTKATLLDAIGSSLFSLGAYDQATSALEETLRLLKAKLGDDHPDTLASMNNLARGYQAVGRLEEAMSLYEESLRLQKAVLGPEHPYTLTSMNNLANGYQYAGRLEEALVLCEETLRLQKAKLGDDHPDTLTSMNNLANAYRRAGQLEEAILLLEQTVRLSEAKLGDRHPATLSRMDNLAGGYLAAGRLEEAVPLFEESLHLKRAKLGGEHPDTLTSMNNLAGVYHGAGRAEEALTLYEEAFRFSKVTLGSEHPDTLQRMTNLAGSYREAGRLEQALPLSEEALRLTKAKLGDNHPQTLSSMNNLASSYQDAGRLEEALPLYEKTFRLRKADLGNDHPDTLISMNNLAIGYRGVGRLEEAIAILEETLRLLRAKLGDDHPNTLQCMHNLAESYRRFGRFEDALPLFEATLRFQKAKLGDDHPNTLHSMNNLALGYQAVGRLEDAIPLFEDTVGLIRAKLGDDHPNTLHCMHNLAGGYHAAGRLEEALPLYREALRLRKAKLGEGHLDTLQSMGCLASALIERRSFVEAEPIIVGLIGHLDVQKQPVQFAQATTSWGGCLLELGKISEAINAAETALRVKEIDDVERWRAETVSTAARATGGDTGAEEQLVKAYRELRKQLAEMKPLQRWYVPRACERVLAMYGAAKQPDKVKEWQEELSRVNAEIERLRSPKTPDPFSGAGYNRADEHEKPED